MIWTPIVHIADENDDEDSSTKERQGRQKSQKVCDNFEKWGGVVGE